MHCYHGAVILIEEQKARIPINGRLYHRRLSACQDSLEASIHIILHRQGSCTCIGLGGSNVLGSIALALKLTLDADSPALHIQVTDSQSHKFRDSHTSMEQNVHGIVILGVVLVSLDKKIRAILIKKKA